MKYEINQIVEFKYKSKYLIKGKIVSFSKYANKDLVYGIENNGLIMTVNKNDIIRIIHE